MRRALDRIAVPVALLALAAAPGCVIDGHGSASGRFEQTLDVPARVRVEVRNGSGNTTVTVGAAGKVRVSGLVRAGSFLGDDQRRIEQVTANPPIELTGSILRIGPARISNVSITYEIEVPADAALEVQSGSGDVEAHGMEGPVKLSSGSGDVRAQDVRQSVEISTGSGDVTVRDAGSRVDAHTGSGDMEFDSVGGDLRARTGSGEVGVRRPGGRVDARTGSGDVGVQGASGDLRLHTSSGDCDIEGDPARGSLWEIETSSGDVTLDVPDSAGFQLQVVGRISRVDTDIPMETQVRSRRELRARVGSGEARVRIDTSSGRVRIH